MSAGYLLDTNQFRHIASQTSLVKAKFLATRKMGIRVGTCLPVLCELEEGIQSLSHPEAFRLTIYRFLNQLRIWPLDAETARHYGQIYSQLRASGRALSQVDIMLAAVATQMDLTLVTADRDFDVLPKLSTLDWTR